MKKILILFAFVSFFLALQLVSAQEPGCCFNPDNGLCSQQAEQSSCSAPGQFFSSASCTVNQCESGCCVLGTGTEWTTSRSCEILSDSLGFEFNWQNIDQQSCFDFSSLQDEGACVYEGEFENECVYTTRESCNSNNFNPGLFCTDPSLDTICELTEETFCSEEDVYYRDTCGNLAGLKENCDYNSGTICRPINNEEAFCKSLDCEGGIKNGEEWCVETNPDLVGSRYFRQYCLDGDVITEPAADFRMESCVDGKLKINPWQECLAANTVNEVTGLSEVDKEACNSEFCKIWRPLDCVRNEETGGEICGEERLRRHSFPEFAGDVKEFASPMLADLNLELCVPQIPGGLNFWPQEGSFTTTDDSACSIGNYNAEMTFFATQRVWKLEVANPTEDPYGFAGLLTAEAEEWLELGREYIHNEEYGGGHRRKSSITGSHWESTTPGYVDFNVIPINPAIFFVLNNRCAAIADCDGKFNWIEQTGGHSSSSNTESGEVTAVETSEANHTLPVSSNNGRERKFLFSYECTQWKAPSGSGSCEVCGSDDLPCSEYRCKALGSGCEYFEPAGIDRGFCTSSNDNNPPSISHNLDPLSPIPPFEPVEITISTDEVSYCRFDMGSSSGLYEDMQYDVDGNWTEEHKLVLSLPGAIPNELELPEFPLINRDGEYEMFVRCEDIAGNWNIASYVIEFEVMQTPDGVPPSILSFNPISGSPIAYNTSEKRVEFIISEPAECKWDENDTSFDLMDNEFDCDESISNHGTLNGYSCSGILDGISSEKNFYIKCKDQPWLEGIEDNIYSRNVNEQSTVYTLTKSVELEIVSMSPTSEITRSVSAPEFQISITTSGGGYNGEAVCDWRIKEANEGNFSIWQEFQTTGDRNHQQTISNKPEGRYTVETRCEDESGNKVSKDFEFKLLIDETGPKIIRFYNDKGQLLLITDEEAICRYNNDSPPGIYFNWENGTSFSGSSSFEHSTKWWNGRSYFIKCSDFFENSLTDLSIFTG